MRVVDAWDLLVDTERWPEWGPSVTEVDCPLGEIRQGTEGRLRLPGGVWVPFAVTHLQPRRRWAWRVFGLPATGHRVDPLDDGCRVAFEVPPLAAGYVPVCRRALDRIADLLE